jgi:hypothetical protein
MSIIGDLIHNSRKIVIKIGSNVLSDDDGFINKDSLRNIVEQIMGLIREGKQVIIVSSGAGICGVATINKWSRRSDINYKQALCAIGQVELMNAYKEFFDKYDIHVGQMFPSEYEAFKRYAEIYPDNCVLLVDTYNVIKSGIPNAIKVFKEMKPSKMGIRIDSGDVTYLTKRAREMLDKAGLHECKIIVSNSLDEYIIRDVIGQGACIDSFGVGERLITSRSEPVFGGVYKLSALEKDGKLIPKMKISENVEKITNPGFKSVYRQHG